MKRLRKVRRLDRMTNDVRARRRYFGQIVYILIVLALFAWLGNFLFGQLVFLRAEGMVAQERQVIAVSYLANVEELSVTEGESVQKGQPLARVRSTQILENVSFLSASLLDAKQRRGQLVARQRFLSSITDIAEKRAHDMVALRERHEEGLRRGVATTIEQREFLKDEYDAVLERERIRSELSTIDSELAGLEDIIAKGERALDEVLSAYGDGVIRAPFSGVVTNLQIAEGSVVSGGDPMMEILTDDPFVLAYLTPGSLHEIAVGDEVVLHYGVEERTGRITRLFPVSPKLPDEFQKSFRPAERSQIFRIDFLGDDRLPPTFTKVDVRAPGGVSQRIQHAWAMITARIGSALQSGG